jgi:capsular polysaccharide transport system permease protein
MNTRRGSFDITLSVWKALFLREALTRLFSGRGTAFWLLVEPLFHVAYIVFIYTVIRVRTIGGIDTALWIVVGILTFFIFRRSALQSASAVTANYALFTYRQVKPIDAIIVRSGFELFLIMIVATIVLCVAALLGHNVIPSYPAMVLIGLAGIWFISIAWGFIASVAEELAPELGRIIKMFMTPLYVLSGVIFPIASVPDPYRSWLLLNPLVHALEIVRVGFVPHYSAVPNMSIAYLYKFALIMLFFGLALQRRFALRLVTQ